MITRFLRGATALVVALATFLAIGLPASAAPADPLAGDPGLTPDHAVGYYLWRGSGDTLHLRTHGPGDEHDFVATLHTDGYFAGVDGIRLESRDGYSVRDGGHTLALRVRTFNWTDGLTFQIRGGSRLRLSLELDGAPVATESIYLGALGRHPANNPFTVRL